MKNHPTRLDVRPLAVHDSAAFLGIMGRNQKRFEEAGLASLPATPGAFVRFIERNDGTPSGAGESRVVYGVFVGHDDDASTELPNRLVGFVGVQAMNRFQGAGVWYGLEKDLGGAGVAKTGALLAMADFSRRMKAAGLQLPGRWVAHIKASNDKSRTLAESMGFARDDLLDYTRSTSARGGTRFQGFWLERDGRSMAQEAKLRLLAAVEQRELATPGTGSAKATQQPFLVVIDEVAAYAPKGLSPEHAPPPGRAPARRRARP